jgi:hypothetical protein
MALFAGTPPRRFLIAVALMGTIYRFVDEIELSCHK